MKKSLSIILSSAILAASVYCSPAPVSAEENGSSGQVKNIIYLIPDGGGYGLYDFANMVKLAGGFDPEKFPNKTPTDTGPMSMRSQLAGSMTTASASSAVTDSAAAGTAMSTGHKTINGYVGIDKKGIPKANLVEAAESVGKATGIISTYHWSHATPAAFTAHATDRGDDYNIYQQIENKGLEVVLGVGYGMVSQYGATIQNAVDRGYTVVETKEDLLNVSPGDRIWGNVAEKTYPYDVELGEAQPTLAEMTSGAIKALSGDPDGFFLMVEGGKVDTGGHRDDARITTSEYLAFDAAFKAALDFAEDRTDTVVICAPDHDTGGMIIPEDPEAAVAEVMKGINPASVLWESYSHTGQNVGVWAYVPEGVSLIEGLDPVLGDTQSTREDHVIDNTELAPWCAGFMGVDLDALSEELFVNVSGIGKYSALTRKFTFNNGDKYVYSNQDEYYKDGVKISTNGRTAFHINNDFYVPAEMVDEEDWDHVSEAEAGDGITGKGTASDPYILDDASDFMEFTGNMLSGMSYKGKYIRQAKDIDLSAVSDYKGIGDGAVFAGMYDGNGKKIKVNISSDADVSVFPKVTGILMNAGTEGTIATTKSGGYASGVAYYVGTGGKLANCYSNAKIQSAYAAGLAVYNMGYIGNCCFCGTLTGSKGRIPIAANREGYDYEFQECLFLTGSGSDSFPETLGMTETQAKTQAAERLNGNRKGLASKLGFGSTLMSYWTNDNGYPELYTPIPIVDSVTITPRGAVVDKGDGILLSAAVTGQYDPSKEVTWSIEGEVSEGTTIASDGFLVIDKNEAAASFGVMAKSNQDGGKADTIIITVGDNVISESDGTRARPYLIETAEDFKTLSDGMIAGNEYPGVYFRQTKNIDLSGLEGYSGVGSGHSFAGYYDGKGHTVNIDIASDTDECLFPSLTGTVLNLGVTGSVKNASAAGSVAASVQEGGRIVNCWSNAYVEGDAPGGIAPVNYGMIVSCFFWGTLDAVSGKASDIAVRTEKSVDRNNYYIGNEYIPSSHNSEVTYEQLKDEAASGLNIGLANMAKAAGVPASGMSVWYYADGILSFSRDNTMTVAGDPLTVTLYGNTSIGTVYAVMYDAGGKMIGVRQYPASETVEVGSEDDAECEYVKIMWWHGNMRPMCEAETVSL